MPGMVTFLSGGTGTPKLLWGADGTFPRTETTVIANTGDDIRLGDLYVSPDCDTVLFERAGLLDRDTWWGIADDPTVTHDRLTELAGAVNLSARPEPTGLARNDARTAQSFNAVPEFMTIGDHDRAHHLIRSTLLETGNTLTQATRRLADGYDITIELLPMSDHPVVTYIHTPTGPMHFQEYWVGHGGEPQVDDVEFIGAADAHPSESVMAALSEPVVIGPANPVTSLGPMLAMERFRRALADTPVVAVSPFVGETVFSGPAPALMRGIGLEPSTRGFAEQLSVVDAFILDVDDPTDLDRPTVHTDTRIRTPADAGRVARACQDALAEVG